MNRELAKKVADTVLYEGYMLYPYRPSAIKNRQRWTFGILYPPAYPEVGAGTERSVMHSECLVATNAGSTLEIELRFLHLVARQVENGSTGDENPVESWDEGVERSVKFDLALLDGAAQRVAFNFPASYETEPLRDRMLRDGTGTVLGCVSRTQSEVTGTVFVASTKIRDGVLKLAIDVANESSLPPEALDRNSALLRSLLSAHMVLAMMGGEFVSLLDPPDDLREAASSCRNVGNFPVLVGSSNERDMLLCSPILLYDYPQIAPESAGDFYDATEMDEMLTLRVMTLTGHEKDEMRMAGDHARRLLERTEESAREQLRRTHGTIRSLRPVSGKP